MEAFLVLAGLSEAITQVVVQVIEGIQKKSVDWWKMPLAALFAALLLYVTGLNVFLLLGVPLRISGELQLVFASICGGLLVGRWGAAVNDLLDALRGVSDQIKAKGDAVNPQ